MTVFINSSQFNKAWKDPEEGAHYRALYETEEKRKSNRVQMSTFRSPDTGTITTRYNERYNERSSSSWINFWVGLVGSHTCRDQTPKPVGLVLMKLAGSGVGWPTRDPVIM